MESQQETVSEAQDKDNPTSPFLLTDKRFAGMANIRQRLQSVLSAMRGKASGVLNWFSDKFKDLSFSQWCYFIAVLMLLSFLSEPQEDDDYMIVVGVIAGAGLLRELWQTFMKIWEHTLGKGILFVLYASTANIALAVSALKINSISGIEPQTFVFTMGFTTMLMLPFWILLASVFFLGSAIVLLSIWSMLSLVLRIFRIRLATHWEDKSFALLTMWMRIIFIPFLMYVFFTFLKPYYEQLNVFDEPFTDRLIERVNPKLFDREVFESMTEEELLLLAQKLRSTEPGFSEKEKAILEELSLTDTDKMMIRNMSEEDLSQFINSLKAGDLDALARPRKETAASDTENIKNPLPDIDFSISTENAKADPDPTPETEPQNQERAKNLDKLIAKFIYQFETYRYSACKSEPNQRVLTIDENTIFVTERDPSQELGFKFSVAPCIPKWAEDRDDAGE